MSGKEAIMAKVWQKWVGHLLKTLGYQSTPGKNPCCK